VTHAVVDAPIWELQELTDKLAAAQNIEGADAAIVVLPDDDVKPTDGVGAVVVFDADKGTLEVVREDSLSFSLESSPCSESNERCDLA
jgi:hypothetical protein